MCSCSHKVTLRCLMFSANSRQSKPSEAGSGRIGLSSSLGTSQDRLKPPVAAVNMEHKVIKLGGSKNAGSSSSLNIHQLKQPVVTESNSVRTSCHDSNTLTANFSRKIKLSQPDHTSVSATDKQQQQQPVVDVSTNTSPAKRMSNSTEETEKKKFKATAITWP